MIKNILNYTKILICFAIFSLLLLSISYAIVPSSTDLSYVGYSNFYTSSIPSGMYSALNAYKNTPNQANLDNLISIANSYNQPYVIYKTASNQIQMFFSDYDIVACGVSDGNTIKYLGEYHSDTTITTDTAICYSSQRQYNGFRLPGTTGYPITLLNNSGIDTILSTSLSYIPLLDYVTSGVVNWDGTSVLYGTSPTPTPTPTPTPSYIPTNEEIAEKVQAFYNSDLFQNQNDFKDYFVLYNYNNETFSFIGHNLVGTITDTNGSHDNMSLLGQVIYSADYPTNTVGQDYWSFRFENDWSHIVNFFNGGKYYLFSTTLDSETITYNGTGTIPDLVQLKFDPTYSTIVYSTKDYMVTIFDNPSPPDPDFGTSDIMPGDLYTYDENIDPTTSEYNPITNYVLPNSVDTLISNADIPGLLQIWVTPDFSNMDWIFACISAFWGYFGGFVLLTAIMFFIMWILRG